MANDPSRVSILQELMQEAGLPIQQIDVLTLDPISYQLTWKPEATAEQIALGEQMSGAFDWRQRRHLPRGTVVASIGNLTVGQRAIIDAHMRAEHLRNNPRLAALISKVADVPIVVDEVDPT